VSAEDGGRGKTWNCVCAWVVAGGVNRQHLVLTAALQGRVQAPTQHLCTGEAEERGQGVKGVGYRLSVC
jgi:hypothetical protein